MVKKKNKGKSSRMAKVAASSTSSGGNDISNRTVMIVLIVVILVSVVSMVTYMQALEHAKPKLLINGGLASGKVQLTLVPQPGPEVEQVVVEQPKSSEMGGKVALTLLPKN